MKIETKYAIHDQVLVVYGGRVRKTCISKITIVVDYDNSEGQGLKPHVDGFTILEQYRVIGISDIFHKSEIYTTIDEIRIVDET